MCEKCMIQVVGNLIKVVLKIQAHVWVCISRWRYAICFLKQNSAFSSKIYSTAITQVCHWVNLVKLTKQYNCLYFESVTGYEYKLANNFGYSVSYWLCVSNLVCGWLLFTLFTLTSSWVSNNSRFNGGKPSFELGSAGIRLISFRQPYLTMASYSGGKFKQDMPPPGGYADIEYKRIPAQRIIGCKYFYLLIFLFAETLILCLFDQTNRHFLQVPSWLSMVTTTTQSVAFTWIA